MTRWLCTLVPVLALLSGCTKPLPPGVPLVASPIPVGAEEWRVVDRVVVVTDASGSMSEGNALADGRALTERFIASLPSPDSRSERGGSYEVGLIGFGGDARRVVPLRELDRESLADSAARLNYMGFPQPRTPLEAVVGEVADALAAGEGSGRVALVVFSDGAPDSEGATLEATRALIAGVPEGVCVHTVRVGSQPGGDAFLQRLAALSDCGGTRHGDSLAGDDGMRGFTRTVLLGAAPGLPPVSAPSPCRGIVRLRGLNFDFDKSDVRPEGAVVLDAAIEQLRICPDISIRIEGHTDAVGTAGYNLGLSERRATSVRRYLVGAGISGDRLESVGLGKDQPIAPNETAEGRAENRRVELKPAD